MILYVIGADKMIGKGETMNDEINKEELIRELKEIKGALGLEEVTGYPSWFYVTWGTLILIGGILSQLIDEIKLPGYYYAIVWSIIGLLCAIFGSYAGYWSKNKKERLVIGNKPNIGVLWIVNILGAGILLYGLLTFMGEGPDLSRMVWALFSVIIGITFVVQSTLLKAYYVKKKIRNLTLVFGIGAMILGILFLTTVARWGPVIYGIYFFVIGLCLTIVSKQT
jgi:hypothetical protein